MRAHLKWHRNERKSKIKIVKIKLSRNKEFFFSIDEKSLKKTRENGVKKLKFKNKKIEH